MTWQEWECDAHECLPQGCIGSVRKVRLEWLKDMAFTESWRILKAKDKRRDFSERVNAYKCQPDLYCRCSHGEGVMCFRDLMPKEALKNRFIVTSQAEPGYGTHVHFDAAHRACLGHGNISACAARGCRSHNRPRQPRVILIHQYPNFIARLNTLAASGAATSPP